MRQSAARAGVAQTEWSRRLSAIDTVRCNQKMQIINKSDKAMNLGLI
jgi:hypothetical protein